MKSRKSRAKLRNEKERKEKQRKKWSVEKDGKRKWSVKSMRSIANRPGRGSGRNRIEWFGWDKRINDPFRRRISRLGRRTGRLGESLICFL